MRKPNNYENTQAQGEFVPVELGGHTLVIKQVEERMSRTNKPRELEKRVLRWFVSHDKAEEAEIPMETETQAYKDHINGYPGYPQGSTPAGDGFMNIPDGIDEELPFN